MEGITNLKAYQELLKLKKYIKLDPLLKEGNFYTGFINNKKKFSESDLRKILAILKALEKFINKTTKAFEDALRNYEHI